jgi:hypothetical protein
MGATLPFPSLGKKRQKISKPWKFADAQREFRFPKPATVVILLASEQRSSRCYEKCFAGGG